MSRFWILLSVSWLASGAAAGELPPPPELTSPPTFAPYAIVPGPSPEHIQALAESGRRNKRIGAILMGVGGGIAAAGTALLIAGDWDDGCKQWSDDQHHGSCGASSLSIAGATTAFLGSASLITGVIVYVTGGSDASRARRLQRTFWGPISLQPTLSPGGAGVQLHLEH
jgi:hypothetical protein